MTVPYPEAWSLVYVTCELWILKGKEKRKQQQ